MQEEIFTFLLIIWTCQLFSFLQVGALIIMILRASVLSADEKPENNFYTRFESIISSLEMLEF